jgi:hypothetical protein
LNGLRDAGMEPGQTPGKLLVVLKGIGQKSDRGNGGGRGFEREKIWDRGKFGTDREGNLGGRPGSESHSPIPFLCQLYSYQVTYHL